MKEINPNIITKSEVSSGGVVACRNRRKSRSKFRIPPSIKKSMPKKRNLCAIRRKPSIWLLGNPESLSPSLSLLSKKRGGGYRDKQHSSRSLSISLALVFFISWLVRSCSLSFSIMDQILVISYDVASCVCLSLSRSWWFLKLSRAQRCLIKPFTLHKYTAGISFNTGR